MTAKREITEVEAWELLNLSYDQLAEIYTDVAHSGLRTRRHTARKLFPELLGAPKPKGAREAVATSVATAPQLPVEIVELQEALKKTLKQRDALADRNRAYIAALRSAVFEAAEELTYRPVKQRALGFKQGDGTEEIACLDVGDWQLGKVTPTYNSEVCEERIKFLAEKVIHIARVQNKDHPVRTLHLRLLGDMVEGEGIFPTQAHVIDASLYRQIMSGIRILEQLIMDLLTFFEHVHVTGVIGNHGQVRLATGASDPETNMDRLLYSVVRYVMRDEDRVTWDIPDGAGERNWFAVDRVFDWGFLLAHGDQIRGGFAGFPFYGAAKKAWGWIDSIDEPWDYLHFGHWHTPTMGTINRRIYRCNGSTESSNTYAQENLAAIGSPCQWLGFVHPEHGVTGEYWVNLAGPDSPVSKTPNKRREQRWNK